MRLSGRRILVARARPGGSEIADALRALGAEVIEAPQIDVVVLEENERFDDVLGRLDEFDGVVFACAAGIGATLGRLHALGRDLRALPALAIIAIGKQANDRLATAGLTPSVWIPGACRAAIGAEAGLLRARRLLLVTSEDGRPSLQTELEAVGARVVAVCAYRLRRSDLGLGRDPFDLIVLPSSSAARNLFESDCGAALTSVPSIALGPMAEGAAQRCGATRVVRSQADTVASAVAKAVEELDVEPVQS